MVKKALIVTALSGFISAFLKDDILILQNLGFDVECAANNANSETSIKAGFFEDLKVSFHNVPFDSKSPASKENIKAYNCIKKIILNGNYEVVHVHTPISGFLTRLAIFGMKNKPKVLYTTHGFFFHEKSPLKSWIIYYPIEKIASINNDAIITINTEDFKTANHMWAKRVYKINSVGLDVNRFCCVDDVRSQYRRELNINPNQVAIIMAGEFSDRKNHKIIIEALSKLDRDKYVFVMCGNAMKGIGTYDIVIQSLKEKGINYRMLGFRTDMPELMHSMDICALPSKREGLGMVGLQALVCGIPVIGADVQGIKEYVINGETGFLCSNDKVDTYVKAIEKLSDEGFRICMKDKCISKAKEFSNEISYAQKEAIYKAILK